MIGDATAWAIILIGAALVTWGSWPYLHRPGPAPTGVPAPRRKRRPLTYRRLARAPDGFDDAIGAGDWAMREGQLTVAATWYSDAYRRGWANRGIGWRYYFTESILRLNVLTGLCLCPPHGFHPIASAERWAVLRELAAQGFLAGYQPAIARLGSMLYRVDRNRENLSPEGRAAWRVLMACRKLPLPALEFLDGQLLAKRLYQLRSQLATHPAATRDLWLSMLKYERTPDLVSTIWEIAGAAEDEEVKAALTVS